MRNERSRANGNGGGLGLRGKIWIIVAVLLLAGVIAAKPVYRRLKAFRADQFAAEGDQLVQAGKLNEAAGKYRAALQLTPIGYRPLKSAARLATRAGRPEAQSLWEQIVRLPECTNEDRQEYVAFVLQGTRPSAAEKILEGLLKENPDTKTLSLAARYSQRMGSDAKALEFARLAVSRAPDDDATRFLLAEILAASSDPKQHAEARQILWLLAEKDGDFKKSAIEALAKAPNISPDEQKRALKALDELPVPTVLEGLFASELRLRLNPEAAEDIYSSAVSRWGQGDTTEVAELSRWLNFHKQAERVLSLLPEGRVLDKEPLLLSRLDALANAQRWDEINTLLDRPDLALEPAAAESFRARTALGRAAALEADVHWDRAVGFASGDPSKLRFVGNFAEQNGARVVALKCYDQLSKFPEWAGFAHRARQRLTEESDDTLAARTVAKQVAALAPDDVTAQAQLYYLNLLLNVDPAESLKKAKALAEKYPNRLAFRVTAALGFLRRNDPGSALAQFNAPAPIEWERTPVAWRAVYAATLAANDQKDSARKMAATIPADGLKREERDLIALLKDN